MNINKDNYEIWFLDYAEGNLTETQVNELMSFVELHPELKAELDDFEVIILSDVVNIFPDKNLLKKKGTPQSHDFIAYHEGDLNETEKKEIENFISNKPEAKIEFDQLAKMYLKPSLDIQYSSKSELRKEDTLFTTDDFIAFHEGDLNKQDQKALLTFLESNNESKNEFERLASVYLVADGNIVYPNKANLKKKEGKIIYLNWQYIAAAASILLVLSIFFFQKKSVINNDNPLVKKEDSSPILDSPRDIKLFPEGNENEENGVAIKQDDKSEVPLNDIPNENKSPSPINKTPFNFADAKPSGNDEVVKKGQESIEKKQSKDILPVVMETKPFTNIALESDKPMKLKASDMRSIPNISIVDDHNVAQENTKQDKQPISVLAFVEQKAANIVTDEKSDKLRLFDVLKKVGEKSRLYDLDETVDNKYSLKIAKLELEGKRKKVTL